MQQKYVYFFGAGKTEGKKEMKDLLGGKGANLAEMAWLGIPVPPGFTITTQACEDYYAVGKKIPSSVKPQVEKALKTLETVMGKKFGDPTNPLLLSVRSGAAASMPGMMDTILNLGLNDTIVLALAKKTGNERFAWDSYRRLIQMFGDVVMGIDGFEKILEQKKETKGVVYDTELTPTDLKELVASYKQHIKKHFSKQPKTGLSSVTSLPIQEFPQDVFQQLWMAIEAVFGSWNNERAIAYRKLNNIKGLKGTAVNIQAMVFGNMGERSGTGVCFSRDPATGEKVLYGEYLINAQGEDVVAGIRTPQPIEKLKEQMPKVYDELTAIYKKLELHYKDVQDMEFTIEEGKLYMLQTRNAKRTAQAAVKIAVDLVKEKIIDEKTAILRIKPEQFDQLLHKQLDPIAKKKHKPLAKGLPASPGAAVGKIAFDNESAVAMKRKAEPVILVRSETSPEDLIGMDAAVGILTSTGGMTSHAAVVARGMGKCCIAGCAEAKVNEEKRIVTIAGTVFHEGDYLTLDGSTGEVYAGTIPTIEPTMTQEFATLLGWANKYKRLGVRTNADIPKDASIALQFGAEGIGLCRTEHMFFEGQRIRAMREMILAHNLEGRKKALAKIKPYQKQDFIGLFTVMAGKPITIRLLDPPLHEFLPTDPAEIASIAKEQGVKEEYLKQKIKELHEVNPMLGHRGCRLGITYPEITQMQAEAIFEAAKDVAAKGIPVAPEIMIPLVGDVAEFRHQAVIIKDVAQKVLAGTKINYLIGTMIEVPRAALLADTIAKEASFFSFGTNDLTQMTFGFSRDDVGKFIPEYVEKGLLEEDPFQVLDQKGVGQLIEMAVSKGKTTSPQLKVGICGEHGGEPSSVMYCHRAGLDYVSCSPYRVPIAKLAAAHAALAEDKQKETKAKPKQQEKQKPRIKHKKR
ncbi:MAG: pyruvate, phosphate dikinase [Candidatus Woesearchaeota archaeon]